MSDHEKSIIKRVLEKKNLLYDFVVFDDNNAQRNNTAPIEECGDIELPTGWTYTPPSWIRRTPEKNMYYILCQEKTGLKKIRAELSKNINLTIIWITIFISVCTSSVSSIIVKLLLRRFFGFGL